MCYRVRMFTQTWNPPNRFAPHELEWEIEPPRARLQVLEDDTRGILARNDSPDVDFDWSLNAYRGCTHACGYCFARTFHELLGYGAGSDFERRIVVKVRAPELLAQTFESTRWKGERIAMSTATDCYQGLEKRYELTRRCLQVCEEYRNPVTIVTRSPLVLRDLDVLGSLARHDAVGVTVSLPIANVRVCRALEPGAPPPATRIAAIRELAAAGIPVGVSIAPVIPGLNDRGVPEALKLARQAGAQWAWFSALRLPGAVAEVFERRLRAALPERADSVLRKIARSASDVGRFGDRLRGPSNPAWDATRRLFELWHRRLGFTTRWAGPAETPFRRPGHGIQMALPLSP